jgi:hypothetical protein
MKSLVYLSLVPLLAALASGPVAAQQRGVVSQPGHGVNPSLSLSAPATTPLQQQMQDDYAAQLRATQRDLLQRNPSGLTRQELAIGHELNGYAPR